MPKGHKRKKNPGVGIDFRKAKHKVGRKLPQAQNETDTTVKSQKLVLAEQSVGVDKSGLATTSRNNTLKELLSQCSHYSDKVRLKALNGLIDLLKEYPLEAKYHASDIVATTSAMASDSHQQCRDAYCSLLRSAFFPAIGERALYPFLPYLMGHICSAMTHLSHGIRASGIDMMNVVLEWRPDVVGQQYFTEICQHFIEALGKSSRGRSLHAGSLKNLLSLVQGCHTFLKATLPYTSLGHNWQDSDGKSHVSGVIERLQTDEARKNTILLQWRKCYWDPSRTGKARRGNESSDKASMMQSEHATKLFGVLLECWEECGMTSIQSDWNNEPGSVTCGVCVLQCLCLLLATYKSAILMQGRHISEHGVHIFTRIFPFFPSLDLGQKSLVEIQWVAADLISMSLFEMHSSGYLVEENDQTSQAIETLVKWCSMCFERSSSDPTAFSSGAKISKRMLSLAKLPLRCGMLSALATAWSALPADHDDRNKGIKFLCDIFRPPLLCYENTRTKENKHISMVNRDSDEILAKWISEIPSLLWKIQKSQAREYTFRLGIAAMLNASRYIGTDPKTQKALPNISRELEELTIKIVPLFALRIKGKIIPGPLSKMPEDLQSLAVHVLYHLPGLDKCIVRLLSECVENKEAFPVAILDMLFEVVYFKSQYGDPEQVWGLIYSIMQGSNVTSFGDLFKSSEKWDFENFLLNRISRIALHCSPPSLALQSVLPPILDIDSSSSSDSKLRSSYGALFFLHQCLLLNRGDSLDISREILDKAVTLCATLHVFAKQIVGIDGIVTYTIDKLARETTKLLLPQCEQFLNSVIEYISSIDTNNVDGVEVILVYLLGALDRLEFETFALKHLKSAYPSMKDSIEKLQRDDTCPENIKNISKQFMLMYTTIIH